MLNVTEHLRGHKISAVSAAKKAKRTSRAVTLARAQYSVAGGATGKVRMALNRTGKKLLAKHHRLHVRLSVVPGGEAAATATKTITVRSR
jgi:hypothetical protein